VKNVCHICGTEYSGMEVGSWYSGPPKPEIKPLVCPKCGAPYRRGVEPHFGMTKEVLYNLLESKEGAIKTLLRFSRTKSDLAKWIEYIKSYATPDNFKGWNEFEKKFLTEEGMWAAIQMQQKDKPDASKTIEEEIEKQMTKINKVEEMYASRELLNLLDEVKKEIEIKLEEESNKYKPS